MVTLMDHREKTMENKSLLWEETHAFLIANLFHFAGLLCFRITFPILLFPMSSCLINEAFYEFLLTPLYLDWTIRDNVRFKKKYLYFEFLLRKYIGLLGKLAI